MEFGREDFEEWVKQGLKLSHGINLTNNDDDNDNDKDKDIANLLIPTSPVAFAFVTDPYAMTTNDDIKLPAMIPLDFNKFSVKLNYLPDASSLRVSFRASWTGNINNFRIEIPNCSNPDVEPDSTCEPMFGDVYFFQRNMVDGGAEVFANFSYALRIPRLDRGIVSFSVPLCFPFYARSAQGDREGEMTGTRRCKIRLYLNATKGEVINDYSVNYPLKVIIKEDDVLVLLQELEGSYVDWPDRNFACTFSLAAR